MKLYGIANCDTVKKARAWLEQHNVEYRFHDFKKQGLELELAQRWLQQIDWENLINRKGLTWRGLSAEQKQAIKDNASALPLLLEKTSVIKRPLLEQDDKLLHIGFDDVSYEKIFNFKS
ncbi:MAG: transcriptional regulator, Spx/MgsR family [Candidatus Nitrotoga sp. SPKER]|nr:MAG: transcriptional regulator, Spx/MgsR family [Candidatus Nitrotoga sp. SPKER]